MRSDRDDRYPVIHGEFANTAYEFNSIHERHLDINDQQVYLMFFRPLQSSPCIVKMMNSNALVDTSQYAFDNYATYWLIVNDQYLKLSRGEITSRLPTATTRW